MTHMVAVAGKGGVGKTAFAALAVRHFHQNARATILAVDADPNASLGEALGHRPTKTIGQLREELGPQAEGLPPSMSKVEATEYGIRMALEEASGFDLLTMGRPEGPGCYCFVNSVLRTLLDGLSARYPYVVIDNEAGLEHLSRRTTSAVDILYVLADGTRPALQAAVRVAKLAQEMELKIKRTSLVLNRAKEGGAVPLPADVPPGLFDGVWAVRYDPQLEALGAKGAPLTELPVGSAASVDVRQVLEAGRGSA